MEDYRIIELVKWDSDFFGMKVGKIRLSKDGFDKSEFLFEQERERFDLIYGFSVPNQNSSGFWESLGFYLGDCVLTLSMKYNPKKYRSMNFERCDKLSGKDLDACYEISEMTASVSRFYYEPLIGERLTKKMYRKWIDTALDGSFSDSLFVERIEGKIVGLHAVRSENNAGIFTLTGVRKDLLGQGIGRKLWNQSFAYWANCSQKKESVKSKFSARNTASFGFHISMGFDKVEETSYIYHYSKQMNKNK